MKVDFEKAYDSVRYRFIQYMLEKLELCRKWIKWITECLTSMTISILINGNPIDEFKPTKIIR